jgi:hypothetical protein
MTRSICIPPYHGTIPIRRRIPRFILYSLAFACKITGQRFARAALTEFKANN